MSLNVTPLPLPPVADINSATNPRAFMGGALAYACLHLGHASDHLVMGDGPALMRSVRKFAAFAKAALDTLPEAMRQLDEEGGHDD
ncbi:MAG: hypothetical protein J0I42_18035 [Bosea sp.]|uniref:hypothetical protein n=1 Tax=Bosea sp. (in: a-proteobacteria) TaxID=1871050 RepID=UPI001AC9439D|nr:hypothetical protein [Bosea sp. (in: a-proteobacteria)]MBN9453842.1 hypothetical protein [Bosea sp. (in: a-proteobacteria)]